MLTFHAPLFVIAVRDIQGMRGVLAGLSLQGFGGDSISHARGRLAEPMQSLASESEKLQFSSVVTGMLTRLIEQIQHEDQLTISMASAHLQTLLNAMLDEMLEAWFLMIPRDRREFYLQLEPPFGARVEQVFPQAFDDIAAAGRCLALDEWTAAVFHLMRVLEIGLRKVPDDFNVPNTDRQEWAVLTDRIEAAVKALERKGHNRRTDREARQLKFYSEAATQFRHFRNAWRNHVAHAHGTYDERRAFLIWLSVQTFMHEIAEAEPPL